MEHEAEGADFAGFVGTSLVSRGPLLDVARALKAAQDAGTEQRLAAFESRTGRRIDLDLSGHPSELEGKLREHPVVGAAARKRGPGRPRLGVVAREVSLLPRHWQWLAEQKGGASAALRRLVDRARGEIDEAELRRRAAEAVHTFLWDIAGNEPGFEEASRALFAHDWDAFLVRIAAWPADVRRYASSLLARVGHTASV